MHVCGCVQVGVDINAVVSSTWKGSPLPFIAGLGPRKAAALVRAVLQKRAVACRKDLWSPGMAGRNVFRSVRFCGPERGNAFSS